MKAIAMYLPQFHRLPENDEWWGKGFTEWTTVTKAEKFFDTHNQPRVPLNQNYYNLLEKDAMSWQAELMKKYDIYALGFYHYWFKDGRQILEKPAENLLRWKDLNMPFCFSWANEPWARTWSNLNFKNAWAGRFEKEHCDKNNNSGILLEQNYGDEDAWKSHFNYLLPFFQDDRYVKIDGKPVFIIYRPMSIPCLERMVEYWRDLAKTAGLNGLYLIGTNITQSNSLDAILIQEPQYAIHQFFDKRYNQIDSVERLLNGQEVWDKILRRKLPKDKVYLCGFPGYDDSPRKGSGGTVVQNLTPDVFRSGMKQLIQKSIDLNNEFVFVNAWNEWGEGMYLEPDERYQFQYLEAIKEALCNYQEGKLSKNKEEGLDDNDALVQMERYQSYWRILNKWLLLLENNQKIESYFIKKKYHNIAVYGIGMIGMHLVKQLENSSCIKIQYGIDQRGKSLHQSFPVYTKEENLENVDVVIVSVTYDYYNIYQYLKTKLQCPIISLEEVIEEFTEN